MKYLCNCLIFSFLFLATGLSGQQYRLRLDLEMSGVFNSDQDISPVVAASLEALINLSPRTFLVPEAGVQLMHISNTEFVAAPLFIPG
ncbi:MAG: hypothetical protein AB8H12_03655 [Lewinella sp.]